MQKNKKIYDLLTVEDVAALLQVNTRTVRNLQESSGFPAPLRIGRLVRWRMVDVKKWLDKTRDRR